MSGLCGIVALDGTQPERSRLETLARHHERRGPDRTGLWFGADTGLGHCLLATTPEALEERMPLTDDASGCTITADARIDNRAELLAALGLDQADRTVGDGELILRAYLEWGTDCPEHLLGDFAFAVWDPRSASLFCVRDPMGMRQFVYRHRAGRDLVFATDAGAIAAAEGGLPINPDRVADFLGNMEGADQVTTFFEEIWRLPPGHYLTLDRGGLAVQRYWRPLIPPPLRLPSDQAYADAFRAVFEEAVRCRLRSAGPVAAMMSGGMDSNSVVAVASQILDQEKSGPLTTFSAIGPDAESCVETRAIMAAMAQPGIAPTTLCHSRLGSLREELVRQVAESDEPFDASMAMVRSLYIAAARAGHRVMLDGAGGDIVLSSDFHSAALLRRGRFIAALRDEAGERAFWGPRASLARRFAAALWQAFMPLPVRGIRFRAGRRQADRIFLRRMARLAPSFDPGRALVRRRRIQRRDLLHDRIDSSSHLRAILHPNLVAARERYDRVAAVNGIEPRDPFLDLRVISFCLSLPREQRQRDGWPKWILRKAMEAQLPDTIRWRRGKQHLGYLFLASIIDDLEFHAVGPSGDEDTPRESINPGFNFKVETIYLSNWLAYMQRAGRSPDLGDDRGCSYDDRQDSCGEAGLFASHAADLWRRRHLDQRRDGVDRRGGQLQLQGQNLDGKRLDGRVSSHAIPPQGAGALSDLPHIPSPIGSGFASLDGWSINYRSHDIVPSAHLRSLWADEALRVDILIDGPAKDQYRLTFPTIATFALSFGGRDIAIMPLADGVSDDSLHHLLVDQIWPRIIAHEGRLVLHAAGVASRYGALLIAGPSGRGKSTLSASLHRRGLALLGDDAIVVSTHDSEARARAVYPSMRLFPDSIERLFDQAPAQSRVAHYTAKRNVDLTAAATDSEAALPVSAVFFLEAEGPVVDVAPLSPSATCVRLIEHSFWLDPLDQARTIAKMHAASAIARSTRGFALTFPRDFTRLDEVHEAMFAALGDSDCGVAG